MTFAKITSKGQVTVPKSVRPWLAPGYFGTLEEWSTAEDDEVFSGLCRLGGGDRGIPVHRWPRRQ